MGDHIKNESKKPQIPEYLNIFNIKEDSQQKHIDVKQEQVDIKRYKKSWK